MPGSGRAGRRPHLAQAAAVARSPQHGPGGPCIKAQRIQAAEIVGGGAFIWQGLQAGCHPVQNAAGCIRLLSSRAGCVDAVPASGDVSIHEQQQSCSIYRQQVLHLQCIGQEPLVCLQCLISLWAAAGLSPDIRCNTSWAARMSSSSPTEQYGPSLQPSLSFSFSFPVWLPLPPTLSRE